MGDPGLHSKFIEMQQDDRFNPVIDLGDKLISEYARSAMLDIVRITRQLAVARNENHRRALNAALADARLRYWNGQKK